MSTAIPPPLPDRNRARSDERSLLLSLLKWLALGLPFVSALLFVSLFVDAKFRYFLESAGFHPVDAATWPGRAGGWFATDLGHQILTVIVGVAVICCVWADRVFRKRVLRNLGHLVIAALGYGFQLLVMVTLLWQLCLFAIAAPLTSTPSRTTLGAAGLEIPARQELERYEPSKWFRLDANSFPLTSLPVDERFRQLVGHLESLESHAAGRYQWLVLSPFDECRDDVVPDAALKARVCAVATRILGQPVASLEELSRHCERLKQENARE